MIEAVVNGILINGLDLDKFIQLRKMFKEYGNYDQEGRGRRKVHDKKETKSPVFQKQKV